MIVRHNDKGAYFFIKSKPHKSAEKLARQLQSFIDFLISRNPILEFYNGIDITDGYVGDDFIKNRITYLVIFKDNFELVKHLPNKIEN